MFVDTFAELPFVKALKLLNVLIGELHMSGGVEPVLNCTDRVEVRTRIELQAIIPISFDVLIDGFGSTKDELSFVWVPIFIYGSQFVFKAEKRAGKSEVERCKEITVGEILQFLVHG